VLDGAAYAQPLVDGNRVVVATENDSVYGLSVSTGRVAWRTHLGSPMPGGNLPCGNIDPSGITGTPVVDAGTGTVFAVAFLSSGEHQLVALDVATGGVRFRRRVDPAGSDPLVEQQRGALSLANGRVYVVFGGLLGDCGDYHGWVVSAPAGGSGPLVSYRVPTGRKGGIWSPGGAVVGPDGDLYVATGNSSSTASFDYGNSVIRLSSDLRPVGYFAPANWAQLDQGDVDLGSMAPAYLPGGLVFQVGKEGVGYLLRANHLGGIDGQVFSGTACPGGAFGAAAHSGSLVYVPCAGGLVALRLRPGPAFVVAWRGPTFDAGPPVVAGGAVWSIDIGSGALNAFDATDGRLLQRVPIGPVTHFAAPSIALTRIFVPATNRVVAYSGP